ncbi:MAG: hypothetical protein IJO31_06830 [Oscillospiraceae bacterium]|nr:hypothetical protein [Oscillospiraceae bacterium]
MKPMAAMLALLWLLTFPVAFAAETPTEIYTVEELLAIGEDPAGSYILMNDLDLTGVEWPCPDFSGTFDGNGHALLNLELTKPGATTAITIDGNQKKYDTYLVGFFGSLQGAEVKNLQLLNVRALIDIDTPCFLGGLAAHSMDSKITGCTVTGTLELRAFDRMFGVAGLVGYGNGTVENCNVDVTLICTDTDPNTKDEQFMGGIFATGFMDVSGCHITIDGYCSEFGYVHNGGITGMYMRRPIGYDYKGNLVNNTVTGKITFFECNPDRRAYCAAEAGEILGSYNRISNTCDFTRDERKDYSVELRPDMCLVPGYEKTVVAPGCDTYGYTLYTCTGCGYSYKDDYTLFAHTVTVWTVTEAPTLEKEGLSTGSCDLCGLEFTRIEPVLEELPTEAPTEPPTEAPTEAPTVPATVVTPAENPPYALLCLLAICILGAIGVCIALLRPKKRRGGKYAKKKVRR